MSGGASAVTVACLAWVLAAGQPATQPAGEAKLVQQLYGQRIAQALGSADTADNVELGRELLQVAGDSANPVLLRHLLAMEAVKLATPVGSDEATKLARDALALADTLKALKPSDKGELEVQIASRRYDAARKAGADAADLGNLAARLVRAHIAAGKAWMLEQDISRAQAALAAGRSVARTHALPGLETEVDAAADELRAYQVRLKRIEVAETQLQRARLDDNAEQIKAARQSLGLIYLLADGDLAKANSYLEGTGHTYESAVKVGLEFGLDPKRLPAPGACNETVEALSKAAKDAENAPAQVRLATAGMNLCRAFLATNPQGLEAARARLLLVPVEKMAGDSPADRLVRKLNANYGPLQGKIEPLPDGVVRAGYDFSDHRQVQDWNKTEGEWQVARVQGRDALVATPAARQWARLESRLRFRADKPVTLSFLASGRQSLTGVLKFITDNDPRYGGYSVQAELGASGNRESSLRDSGWPAWSNQQAKIAPNTTYAVEIAWDGKKYVTWSVNAKQLCKHEIRYRKEGLPTTTISAGLETYDASAGFDDVKVEGVILEDPSQRLGQSGRSSN